MKKLLLSLVAVAAFAFSTQAQTEKGKVMLGGNVGFSTSKVDGANKSDFNFRAIPSVGYFVSDNIAIGFCSAISGNNKISLVDCQRTIDISNGVVRQTSSGCSGSDDRIWSAGNSCG